MPNDLLSDALKEAYASAPVDAIPLHTLELDHPTFTTPIRVVRNYEDTATWREFDDGAVDAVLKALDDPKAEPNPVNMVGLVARLESDAPRDAGKMVSWIALGFDLDLPKVNTGASPTLTLTMDNVGRELLGHLDLALETIQPIVVRYRTYLSTDISGPQSATHEYTLNQITITAATITAQARLLDIGNRQFPNKYHTKELFPAQAY